MAITTTDQPRTAWWRSPEDPTGPPTAVSNATTILFVVIGLSLAWNLFLLAGAAMAAGNPNSDVPATATAVVVTMVVLNALYLYLTWKVRQGSRRAWITMLVVLGVQAALLLVGVIAAGEGAGLLVLAVPLLALLLLSVPRSSRRYFLSR